MAPRPRWRPVAAAMAFAVLAGCDGSSPPSSPAGAGTAPVDPLAGLSVAGDPTSPNGATWAYAATVDGIAYDLRGVLLKPQGNGPFPAVIISHGAGGNSQGYSRSIARTMVSWGLVCIATNYTHAGGGVPAGSPGLPSEPGASNGNVLRARRLVEILRALGYVDVNRLALHGHSMGAFVTAATAGAYPDLFRVASHTAGGIRPPTGAGAAPTEIQVMSLRSPYQMHHGDRDQSVSLDADEALAAVLSARGVQHELLVYPGADHDDVSSSVIVLDRVRGWYQRFGLF